MRWRSPVSDAPSSALVRLVRRSFRQLRGRGILGSLAQLYHHVRRVLYGYFLRAPGIRTQVRKQVGEALAKMQAKVVPPGATTHTVLPKDGWSEEALKKELDALATMDHSRWEDGYVSGAVYSGDEDLLKLQTDAYGKFTVANPIHPDVFPGVRKMEAEVVAMCLRMYRADPAHGAGTTTSGGTESILMAVKTHREWARAVKGVTAPEMCVRFLWVLRGAGLMRAGSCRRARTPRSTRPRRTSGSSCIRYRLTR